MDWKEIAGLVAGAAPMVGTALGGPAGAALGMGVKVLAGMLGITKEDPTPEEVHAAIKADPDFALKAKALDYQYMMAMREADKQEFLAAIGDIQNARSRQIEHEKATGKSDVNLYVLAWSFVIGFFATLITMTVLICTNKFPATIPDAAIYLLGSLNGCLTAGVGAVVQYFFGKTKDSAAHYQAASDSIPLSQLDKIKAMLGIQNQNGGGRS